MKYWLFMLLFAAPGICLPKSPSKMFCASWPTNMAETGLKNAGVLKIPELDESKTSAIPIAIQKIGKDLYKQVFDITFYTKSGKQFHVVTVNNVSSQECSMSGVDIYLVSRKFGANEP